MLRQAIKKALLKVGPVRRLFEQRDAIVLELCRLREQLDSMDVRLQTLAGSAGESDVDLYELYGSSYFFVHVDDEAYTTNTIAPKRLDPAVVALKVQEEIERLSSSPSSDPQAAFLMEGAIHSCLELLFLHYLRLQIPFSFADIGANIGTTCIPAAKFLRRFGFRGKIYSFEPSPETFNLLENNIALNRLGELVVPVEIAVSSISSKAVLYREAGYSGHNRINNEYADREYRRKLRLPSRIVTTSTLDEFVASRKLQGRWIVKVDTEGNEPRVFQGLSQTAARNPTPLIMEFAPVNISCLTDPIEFLTGLSEAHHIIDCPPLQNRTYFEEIRGDIPGFVDRVSRNGMGWTDLCFVPRGLEAVEEFLQRACAAGRAPGSQHVHPSTEEAERQR